MIYRRLGTTNLDVSAICLGTMTWGTQNTEAEGHEQMDYALAQGVNFFDTAEMYAVPPAAEKADVPSAHAPADPSDTKSPTNDVGAAPVQEPATPTTPVAESKGAEPPKGLVDTGRVDLRIRPWGNVIVDGVAKGASPPVMQLTLPPGSHTIVIQNPAGAPVTKTVEVVAGKSITVRHAFQ